MKKRVYSKRIAAIGMAAAMTVGMHTGAFANDDVFSGNDIESVGGSDAGNSDNNSGGSASESGSETDFNDSEEEEIGKVVERIYREGGNSLCSSGGSHFASQTRRDSNA